MDELSWILVKSWDFSRFFSVKMWAAASSPKVQRWLLRMTCQDELDSNDLSDFLLNFGGVLKFF